MCCQPTRHFSISFPTCGLNHVRLFASFGGTEVAVLGGGGGERRAGNSKLWVCNKFSDKLPYLQSDTTIWTLIKRPWNFDCENSTLTSILWQKNEQHGWIQICCMALWTHKCHLIWIEEVCLWRRAASCSLLFSWVSWGSNVWYCYEHPHKWEGQWG